MTNTKIAVGALAAGDLAKGMKHELLADLPAEGYLLLNHAGDGPHVFVSSDKAFGALDLGSFSKPHGDHLHHYAGDPVFPGFEVGATKPGHVAAGDGKAVLFDDETGDVTTMRLTGMDAVDHFRVPVHDGIAVLGEDGTYMGTITDDDGKRTGVAQVDADGKELERFEQCPGAHGAEETIDVIDAWEESEEWQRPRPALAVTGDVAYVTDPATKKVHVVDLTGEKKTLTADLPETPDELVVTEG
ncbi:hypothetical protein FOB82_00150 [Corynebacterium xerosis]|uniref:Uncharacterized protein n=1 Tax=Corynebacterium xerosis TaxID=1725 RepID=A0A6B8TWK3_9CORY|nr:hypothetical protein [Corynebacterium xerosis]QGS33585.1 hypothetical protein FOB82_00150 [Corynebacterium xerosis]